LFQDRDTFPVFREGAGTKRRLVTSAMHCLGVLRDPFSGPMS